MKKEMQNRKKKKLFIVCLILLECLCLSACSRSLSEDDKRKIAIGISEICSEQFDNGNLEAGVVIHNKQLKKYCDPDKDLYKLLDNKEVQYFYAMILDGNTVLVSTGGEFQSAKGYIVTDQDYELNQTVIVPERLNYDGNLISICSEKYDGRAYGFSAGL